MGVRKTKRAKTEKSIRSEEGEGGSVNWGVGDREGEGKVPPPEGRGGGNVAG